MEQINKPILNSPSGPLITCLSFIGSVLGFVLSSLLSVIILITETHLIFMFLKQTGSTSDQQLERVGSS